MEVVAVDIPDPALEQVSQPGVGVFPDRNEEVRVEAGPVDAGSELVGETAIVCFPRTVKEVLLELVKHHKQGRTGSVACGLDHLVQPLKRATGRRGFRQEWGDRLLDLGNQFAGGFITPGAEDDRDVPGEAPLLDAAPGQLRQLGGGARAEHRTLPGPALGVQERQPGSAKIADQHPLLSVAAEEEWGVLLCVGGQPDEGTRQGGRIPDRVDGGHCAALSGALRLSCSCNWPT